MVLKDRIAAVVGWVQRLKLVRVLMHYGQSRGPVLASGLAYQALFAVFAGLWVAFSIAGLVVSADSGLQGSIIDLLNDAIPGLIDNGRGGAVKPEVLMSRTAFSISGIVALVGLLLTALGWFAAARDSVRLLFDLPPATANPVLLKVRDLALGIGFAALLLLAAGLSFAGSTATQLLLSWLGVSHDSVLTYVVSRVVSLAIAVLFYAIALVGLYRVLSAVRVPPRFLRGGVLIGAIGIAGLTVLSSVLLGGATANPLIASFAVIAGLLLYYNFVCQAILIAAAWMAIGVADAGIVVDQKVFDARLARARALVAEHAPHPEPKRGFWARLFNRR